MSTIFSSIYFDKSFDEVVLIKVMQHKPPMLTEKRKDGYAEESIPHPPKTMFYCGYIPVMVYKFIWLMSSGL